MPATKEPGCPVCGSQRLRGLAAKVTAAELQTQPGNERSARCRAAELLPVW